MSEIVGIAELQQNLSLYLRRANAGARLVVTDGNRQVAELGPAPTAASALDRLIAEGKVKPPRCRGPLPQSLELPPGVDP
ncbi:MAG TPA: hypothetical protein VFT79_03810 [Solirubrobacterales bacterium]|nr:hypothetical protein [Solirubrobacterales bacterium]